MRFPSGLAKKPASLALIVVLGGAAALLVREATTASSDGTVIKMTVETSNTVTDRPSSSETGQVWNEFDSDGRVVRHASIYRSAATGEVTEVTLANSDGMTIRLTDGPECEVQVPISSGELGALASLGSSAEDLRDRGYRWQDDSSLILVDEGTGDDGRVHRTERLVELDERGRVISQVGRAFVDGEYTHEFRASVTTYEGTSRNAFPVDILKELSCD